LFSLFFVKSNKDLVYFKSPKIKIPFKIKTDLLNYDYFNPAICTDKSINLLEYPYSLSYQDMILKKVEFKPIPAFASTIEVLLSETKS
jgi:hypothetical protein